MKQITKEYPVLNEAENKSRTYKADPSVLFYLEGRRKYIMVQESIRREDIRKSRAEGFEEGFKQGVAIKTLLNIIKLLIGEVPSALRSQIENMSDIEKLGLLTEMVATKQVKTFSELEQQL